MSSSTRPPIKVLKTIRTSVSQVASRLSWKYPTKLIASSVIGSEAPLLAYHYRFSGGFDRRHGRSDTNNHVLAGMSTVLFKGLWPYGGLWSKTVCGAKPRRPARVCLGGPLLKSLGSRIAQASCDLCDRRDRPEILRSRLP